MFCAIKLKTKKKMCHLNIGFPVYAMLIHGLCFNSTSDVAENDFFFSIKENTEERQLTRPVMPGCRVDQRAPKHEVAPKWRFNLYRAITGRETQKQSSLFTGV